MPQLPTKSYLNEAQSSPCENIQSKGTNHSKVLLQKARASQNGVWDGILGQTLALIFDKEILLWLK